MAQQLAQSNSQIAQLRDQTEQLRKGQGHLEEQLQEQVSKIHELMKS